MPLGLPSGQYLGFLAYFNRVNNGGFIGRNEVRAILERAGREPTDDEVQGVLDCISVDARGVDFQAFINQVRQFKQLRNVDTEYREAFRIYDRSGTGRVTQEDLEYVFKKLRVCIDVPTLFQEADTDKSGTIEYREFVDVMSNVY